MRPTWITLSLLVCAGWQRASCRDKDADMMEVKFVGDFVEFYRFPRVYLVVADVRDNWSRQLMFWLSYQHHVYVTVVAANNLTTEAPGHHLQEFGLVVSRLRTHNDLRYFSSIFRSMSPQLPWLLVSDSGFQEMLQDVYLPINCKVTIAAFNTESDFVPLYEAYQVAPGLPQKTFRIGDWSPWGTKFKSLNSGHDEESWMKRRDMKSKLLTYGKIRGPVDDPLLLRQDLTGLHLRCVTLHDAPLTFVTEKESGVLDVIGVLGSLFQEIALRTNFTYTCNYPRDGQFGAVVKGNWTGMIRDVLDDVADIGVGGFDITKSRSEVVGYLQGIFSSGYRVYLKKPDNGDYVWSVYTRHFSAASWLTLGMTSFVLILITYWTSNRSPYQDSFSFPNCVTMGLGFLFGQGTWLPLMSTSCRLLALIALLLHVLLMTYYTSDLVSSFAVGPPLPSVSSLYDIYNSPSLKFGFLRGSALQLYFSESEDNAIGKLWRRIQDDNYQTLTDTFEEGMERMLQEPYLALAWEIPALYRFGGDCRILALPSSYFQTQASFVLKKNSPLIPVLNKVLLDVKSTGFLQKWWTDWTPEGKGCDVLQMEPIGLKSVLVPFLVLSFSFLASTMILVVEVKSFGRKKTKGKTRGRRK